MAEPFIGEIRMFGGNFAPQGWAFCEGQLLSIAQNDALFALVGTTYGGDGLTTFGLPDMRGRIPVHPGNGHSLGEAAGSEMITLIPSQLPSHTHMLSASTNAATNTATPADATANTGATFLYAAPPGTGPDAAMNPLGATGGNQPHDNVAPFQCVNFIIALEGIFPSQG